MAISTNTGRKQTISLSGTIIKEIAIEPRYDGKNVVMPNVFQFRNMNSSDVVYMDYDTNVSTTKFILSIDPLTFQKHIANQVIQKIYLYCASSCTVELYTAFDPSPSVSDIDGTQTSTIVNATFTFASVAISAGSKVILTDGTDDMEIESDGSINVNINAGSNNIGDVDVASMPSIPAGTNNIGDVDVASMPSIPAGSNLIGKAEIVDSSNKLKVESDGSINVNGATFSGTIGTVKIEDTAGTNELVIESDGSVNVNLNAGTNNIGDVDVASVAGGQNIKPATTINVYNITCTNASTEYSQALPSNCTGFIIGIASKDDIVFWELKFSSSGTVFIFNGSETYECKDILLSSQTLYFESSVAGEVIQIIAFS